MADFEDRVSDEEKVRGAPLSLSSSRDRDRGRDAASVGTLEGPPGERSVLAGAGVRLPQLGRFPPEGLSPGSQWPQFPISQLSFPPGPEAQPGGVPAGEETFPLLNRGCGVFSVIKRGDPDGDVATN